MWICGKCGKISGHESVCTTCETNMAKTPDKKYIETYEKRTRSFQHEANEIEYEGGA